MVLITWHPARVFTERPFFGLPGAAHNAAVMALTVLPHLIVSGAEDGSLVARAHRLPGRHWPQRLTSSGAPNGQRSFTFPPGFPRAGARGAGFHPMCLLGVSCRRSPVRPPSDGCTTASCLGWAAFGTSPTARRCVPLLWRAVDMLEAGVGSRT